MKVWVDLGSGTFGVGELVWVEMTDEEVEEFEQLSDSERIDATKARIRLF